MTNTTGQVSTAPVKRLDLGGILRDAIVDGIDCFNEFLYVVNKRRMMVSIDQPYTL